MIRRIGFVLLFCVLHAGCGMTTAALGSRIAPEEMPDLPDGWADYASDRTDEFGCPDVNGEYRMAADVYQLRNGDEEKSTSRELIYFNLFIGPLGAEKVDSSASDRGPLLGFERTTSETLILRAYAERTDREISWRLAVGPPDLECVDGFYELPTREDQSMVEGMWANSQIHSRFTRLDDGSLLYYEQVAPLKRLLGAGATFTHRFYRFRQTDHEDMGAQARRRR